MAYKVLAKTESGPNAPPDAAQLRLLIAQIIQQEYSGDVCSEFWAQPARAAAKRIVEALAGGGLSSR